MQLRDPCRAGHPDTRVFVPGDAEPDGTRWPRCPRCGHRCAYAGNQPTSTKRIARRHPLYVLTELRGRWLARRMPVPLRISCSGCTLAAPCPTCTLLMLLARTGAGSPS